jgi:hypothetical protein
MTAADEATFIQLWQQGASYRDMDLQEGSCDMT